MMQRLEMYVDRRLLAGMVAQTIGARTMMSEVGDDRAGQVSDTIQNALQHDSEEKKERSKIAKNGKKQTLVNVYFNYFA